MQNHDALWQAEQSDQLPTSRTFRRVVWQRKWWVLLIVAAFVGLGATYDHYGTPIYEGSARLLLQQVGITGTITKKLPHGVEFVDTQAQVISGPVLVRDAVASLGLPNLDPTNVEGLQLIIDSLKVERVPQTDIVSVAFRNEDPPAALAVVQALIKQYQAYLVQQQKLSEMAVPMGPDLLEIQKELWKAQALEKSLAERFGDKHPEMLAAQETVAHWERLLEQHTPVPATTSQQTELNEELLAKTGGVKIAIIDGPKLADDPVWPNPLIVLPVAAVLGLLAGMGVVVLLDRGDHSVRTTGDVEIALGMHACGQIPSSNGSAAQNIHRFALEAPNSALARAAHALGHELCHGSGSAQASVVQVTSAREQSGKTTVVANLAFSLAAQGKKVCVVDADLRHGILHRVFDVSASKGVSSLTREGASLEELLQTSPMAPIDVLTKGPAVRNPLHLLAQPQVEKALEALRWQYEIVLIDTPPLLRLSDASLLAPLADTVLVVLQARVSSAANVRSAIEMLRSVGTKNIGLVLNGSTIEPWMVDGEEIRTEPRRSMPQVVPSASVS
ncbi:MAG: polysaccharide biosynthesis tyrosine autokinase [Planctomycetia bacterium]|nr:polysaccharide biosynthesis tyrosine autokinase [Planctomycetia bacterium]